MGTPPNVQLVPGLSGYALLGTPDQQQASLTPEDINSGYTVLGVPIQSSQSHTVPQSCEAKSERPQVQLQAAAANSDPFGEYSKLVLPVGGGSEPGPIPGIFSPSLHLSPTPSPKNIGQ